MALIRCLECGKEISESAEHCPNCGCKTNHGKAVTGARVLLVNWFIVVVLMVIGVVFIFSSLSKLGDHSSYYWDSGRWVDDDETMWATIKLAAGIGAIIGGIIDMVKIKRKAESLKDCEAQETPVNLSTNLPPAFIPEEKRKNGVCEICKRTGMVASCKIPNQFGDHDLCPICLRRYNARINE